VSEGNGIGTACVPYLLEIGPANLFVRVSVVLPNEIPNSVKKIVIVSTTIVLMVGFFLVK